MDAKLLHILRHSLGLADDGTGNEYRNGYSVSIDSDQWANVQTLVLMGYMSENPGRDPALVSPVNFFVTEQGRLRARRDVQFLPPTYVGKLAAAFKRAIEGLHELQSLLAENNDAGLAAEIYTIEDALASRADALKALAERCPPPTG